MYIDLTLFFFIDLLQKSMVREALVYEKFYLLIKHIYEKKTLAESQKKDGIAIIVFCLFF